MMRTCRASATGCVTRSSVARHLWPLDGSSHFLAPWASMLQPDDVSVSVLLQPSGARSGPRRCPRHSAPGIQRSSRLGVGRGYHSDGILGREGRVIQLSRDLAIHLARTEVRVNALVLGHIETPQLRALF